MRKGIRVSIVNIPKKVLPNNWIEQIIKYNIDKSDLPGNLKPLCRKIQKNIEANKDNSVTSYFNIPFIKHVCLDEKWTLDIYESISSDLIEAVFEEIGSQTGIQYDTKLYSLFSELFAYKHLVSQGYTLASYERCEGSCDLVLSKGSLTYNCEVKLKTSIDKHSTSILFFIQGKSLLPTYDSLRGIDEVYYKLLTQRMSYSNIKEMHNEIDIFCKNPTTPYIGKHIHLSNADDIPKNISDYIITEHSEKSTADIIEKILIGKDRPLTKLIEKSKKFENFIGYISLNMPFNSEMEKLDIENKFKSLDLGFRLYIDIYGIGIEPYVLEIN